MILRGKVYKGPLGRVLVRRVTCDTVYGQGLLDGLWRQWPLDEFRQEWKLVEEGRGVH